jgi:hypothetical protein
VRDFPRLRKAAGVRGAVLRPLPASAAQRWHLLLNAAFFAVFAAAVVYLCAFKVMDRDFWWHVKAGEIMWKTGSSGYLCNLQYQL